MSPHAFSQKTPRPRLDLEVSASARESAGRRSSLFAVQDDPTSEFLRLFLICALAIDVALLMAFVTFEMGEALGLVRGPDKLDIESAGSLASIFNYGKYFVVVISLATVAVTFPRRGWTFLSALFALLLLDDYAELHDRAGKALGARLDEPPFEMFAQQDRGEPFVYAAMLLVALTLVALAFRRMRTAHRHAARRICLLVVALAAFGVGVDLAHSAISLIPGRGGWILDLVTAIVEETGESVVLTVLLWVSIRTAIDLIADDRTALGSDA